MLVGGGHRRGDQSVDVLDSDTRRAVAEPSDRQATCLHPAPDRHPAYAKHRGGLRVDVGDREVEAARVEELAGVRVDE